MVTVRWDMREGRIGRVCVSFEREAPGAAVQPGAVRDTAGAVGKAGDLSLASLLKDGASALGLSGAVDFVRDDVLGTLADARDAVSNAIGWAGAVMALPDQLLASVMGGVTALVPSQLLSGLGGGVVMGLISGRASPSDQVAGRVGATIALFASLVGATPPDTLTDVQRAARFLTLQRLAYGGKPGSTSFPVRRQRSENLGATDLRQAVEALHNRLARVTIECLDYQEFVTRYDGPSALFYLDPPYYLCEHYYGKDLFARDDFGRLADLLGGIKGRWLMSINDHPEVRRLFRAFRIDEEPANYQVGGAVKPVTELVISSS